MRMMIKAQISAENGNASFKDGSLNTKLESILADTKPEAAYFMLEGGLRTAMVVFDMKDSSELPAAVEPWFLAFGASVTVTPVMNGEDFVTSGPSLAATIQKYG